MQGIEQYKPELQGILPQEEYFRFTRSEQNRGIPKQLLKTFADIPADASGDMFGQIYEYFLAEFDIDAAARIFTVNSAASAPRLDQHIAGEHARD